jgi:hypothetical protein
LIGQYITITFDVPTNQTAGPPLTKEQVDAIVDFNVPGNQGTTFALNYTGLWIDNRTFRITVIVPDGLDPWIPGPPYDSFSGDKIFIKGTANIKDITGNSAPSTSVSPPSTSSL